MNGCYAKFFERPEYFIESIQVDDNNELINVTFKGKDITASYPLNKETLEGLYSRLEEQYEVASKEYCSSRLRSLDKGDLYAFLFITITSLPTICGSDLLVQELGVNPGIFIPVAILGYSIIGLYANYKYKTNKINHLLNLEHLLHNRESLENAIDKCDSITASLSSKSRRSFNEEQNLEEQDLIDSAYSINWLDKCSKSDLEKLAYNLRVYKDLQEPVSFNVKVRRRTIQEEQEEE